MYIYIYRLVLNMNLTGRPKQKYQPNWHDPGQRMRDGGAVGVAWRADSRR